jgi:transcriptional regulator with XRE-family HTH domain
MKHTDYLNEMENDQEYQSGLAELKSHFALGNAMIRARIRKGISQAELAEMAGTKQANISRIESALGNPTLRLINKILEVLDLDLSFVPSVSTNSYKSGSFEPGIPVGNWPTKTEVYAPSTQSMGKWPS